MDPRRIGPVKILARIGPLSYKLGSHGVLRHHDVFHENLLSPVFQRRWIERNRDGV